MNVTVALDLIYSAFGFTVGWLAGRIGRDVAHQNPRPRWWPSVRAGLGILILIMVAYSMVIGVTTAARDREIARCQADLNAQFQKAIEQRSDAARIERASQRKLLLTMVDQTANSTQRAQAIRDYLGSLDDADQQRDQAPYPTNGCG